MCRTRKEAEAALEEVHRIQGGQLGFRWHPEKTQMVHITEGFEFSGFRFWQDPGLHWPPRGRPRAGRYETKFVG